MDIYSFSLLVFGISSLFTGVLIFLDRGDFIGKLFGLYSTALFGWSVGAAIMFNNSTTYDQALFAIRIGDAFILFVPVLWVHLVIKLTGSSTPKLKIIGRTIYFVCGAIALFIFSDFFIPRLEPILGFQHYKVAGPIYNLFSGLFLLLVPFGFYKLIHHISTVKSSSKTQLALKGFLFFSLIGYVAGGLCILPAYHVACPQYGVFLMPFYPFGLGYFMTKYGLFAEEDFAQAAHKDKLAALGILTASINHEIRAPLFVIRGTMEMESQNDRLNSKVLAQVDRITGIVSRLTHFAKKGVEEEAKIEAIDLKEILSDTRPLFQHQLNYQSVEYSQDIPTDLPKVMADRRYLEEILFNLILNACQALKNTPSPKITLTGSVLGTKSRGLTPMASSDSRFTKYAVRFTSEIDISISDNGPGIAPDQQKNIFKPFHTTKSEGTGLGLYITKQLVEKCGGKIEVQSELGKGASFNLIFRAT